MKAKDTLTVKVVLYRSKTLANGEHPLLIRVTRNRKVKYKSLGISCSPKLWDEKNNRPRKSHPNADVLESIILKKVALYKRKQLEFKNDEKEYSADTIIHAVENPVKRITVFQFFDEVIQQLTLSKHIGNADTYADCLRAVRKFRKSKDLLFTEIDYSFLMKFESSLRQAGLIETSISVYFRTLRALFNRAILHRAVKESDYPFKQFKVSKFDVTTRKRAITKDDIKRIERLIIPEDSTLFEARQYFLFSYYGHGINFVDIAHLKWEDVTGDRVFYTRTKTGNRINFKLLEPAQEILDSWALITGHEHSNYIFPILNKGRHVTPSQISNRTHKVLRRVNQDLKEIGRMAGLTVPLTTYVARHTFATVLKRGNVSIAVIKEAMGHQTEATTNTYLNSFENEIIDEASKQLM